MFRYLIFCLLSILFVPAAPSFGQQAGDFVSALRKLKENWNGLECEFESARPSREPSLKPIRFRAWLSDDGFVIRTNSKRIHETKAGTRVQDSWKFLTQNFLYTRSITWLNNNENLKTTDSAWVQGKKEEVFSETALTPVHCFFGLDRFTGVYWYEVMDDPSSKITIKPAGGKLVVVARNSKFGNFEFTFDNRSELKLTQVVCKNSLAEVRNNVLSYEYRVADIAYLEFDGRMLIKSIGNLSESHVSGSGKKRTSELNQKLINQSKLSEKLTEQITFPDFSIKDRTSVRVLNDEGIPYEIKDGVLLRVVDDEVVLDAEKAQFREPEGIEYWWYLAFVVLALAGGAMIYRKR